jgi:hypothetical protein
MTELWDILWLIGATIVFGGIVPPLIIRGIDRLAMGHRPGEKRGE